MVELKLSQRAKPGHGGVLPAAKLTREIARIRGVESRTASRRPGIRRSRQPLSSSASLPRCGAFRAASLPASSSASVTPGPGHRQSHVGTGITPDVIVVDGPEGGTGAASLEFMDHLGMPLRDGLTFVHSALVGANT